jgi:hypothetical protein
MRTFTEEEFTQNDDEELEQVNCPHCEKRGYIVQLGPKILMPGEIKPNDYDQWLECPTCMWLCPIYSVAKEATIKNAVETVEYQRMINLN